MDKQQTSDFMIQIALMSYKMGGEAFFKTIRDYMEDKKKSSISEEDLTLAIGVFTTMDYQKMIKDQIGGLLGK